MGDESHRWLILKYRTAVIGLFQGMLERNTLTFDPGWDSDAGALEQYTDIRELQRQLKQPGVQLPAEADDAKALEIALDFERTGWQTYQRLAQETTDPAGRALYEFLGRQEQKHYDYIHRALEYLRTQGAWYYDEQELPMFEG